jgi:hypothetical protein
VLDVYTIEDEFQRWPWYPRTAIYGDYGDFWDTPKRLRSRGFFEQFKPILGVSSLEDLKRRIEALPPNESVIRMGFTQFSTAGIPGLLGLDKIGEIP